MRKGGIVFIVIVWLIGCAHLQIDKNAKAIQRIKPGDSQEEVLQTLGPPVYRHTINDRRFIVFYQTKSGHSADEPVSEALCTPIAFENGVVKVVGEDLTEQWTREENARRLKAEITERERQQAEMIRTAQQRAETKRLDKIKALEEQVRPVPVSNAKLNLKLYRQLHDLAPANPRYQKKVAYYEKLLAHQEQARQEHALLVAKKRQREAWEKARGARNIKLRQYTGNGVAEMAVHDMGNGSLYIWIKNISHQIITTHPDYFTLIDRDDHVVKCKVADTLDSVLEPGSISHGKIEYDPTVIPKELIFQNRESGRISKSFN